MKEEGIPFLPLVSSYPFPETQNTNCTAAQAVSPAFPNNSVAKN